MELSNLLEKDDDTPESYVDAKAAMAGEDVVEAASEPTQKLYKFGPSLLKGAEFEESRYIIDVPSDVTVEQALQPEAYQHIASELNPWDEIKLRWEDMSKTCAVTVLDVTGQAARVAINKANDDGVVEFDLGGFTLNSGLSFGIEHRGSQKWCVIRTSDQQIVGQGYTSRKQAEIEMFNQIRAVG